MQTSIITYLFFFLFFILNIFVDYLLKLIKLFKKKKNFYLLRNLNIYKSFKIKVF